MPTNLIESWLAVDLAIPGRTAADALTDLNRECDTRYTHAQLSEWRRGIKRPSPCAQQYMLEVAIERIMMPVAGKISDSEIDYLLRALSFPGRT